jgi:hypothetical protein
MGNKFNTSEVQSGVKDEKNTTLPSLITENRFYDIKWEIIYEDVSSFCSNITSLKILVKLIFINVNTLVKESVNLIFDEKKFEVNIEINILLGVL